MLEEEIKKLSENGDFLEKSRIDLIESRLSNYAKFWYSYIGNDGNNMPLSISNLDQNEDRIRQRLWEQLYSLFECMVLCHQIDKSKTDSLEKTEIETFLNWQIKYYCWFALVGRIRDLIKNSKDVLKAKFKTSDIEQYYRERSAVLHEKSTPILWIGNSISIPNGGEQSIRWTGENGRNLWKDFPDDLWTEFNAKTEKDVNDLFDVVNTHLGLVIGHIKKHRNWGNVVWSVEADSTPDLDQQQGSIIASTQVSRSMHVGPEH